MPVELSQLMQLVLGQRKFLVVGNLPEAARQFFGCNPGVVYLGHPESLHFFGRHSDISALDALQLGLAVERGRYYKDPKRQKSASIIYHNAETGKPYLVGIKVVDAGEVWIATFHHTNDTKIKQRQNKWELIC